MKNAKSRNKGYTAISGAVGHSGLQWEATRSLICSLTGPNRHQYVQENITWQHDLGPRAWCLKLVLNSNYTSGARESKKGITELLSKKSYIVQDHCWVVLHQDSWAGLLQIFQRMWSGKALKKTKLFKTLSLGEAFKKTVFFLLSVKKLRTPPPSRQLKKSPCI